MTIFLIKPQKQTGMTLVEIMVAMAIGLFLVAGVIQMFVSTKLSYSIQDAVARIDENSRFSLEMLTGSLRLAGYKTYPWQDRSTVYPATTLFPGSGQFISGSEGGLAGSDTVNIRYLPSENSADDRVLDCEGGNVTAVIEISFSLNGTDLFCSINGTQSTHPLAENITNMQILYGVDSSGDDAVNQYVNALAVTDWSDVISVKIGIVFSSEENLASTTLSFPGVSDNPTNVVFDNNADGDPDLFKSTPSSNFNSKTAPDKRIYKVYTTTVALRNRVL